MRRTFRLSGFGLSVLCAVSVACSTTPPPLPPVTPKLPDGEVAKTKGGAKWVLRTSDLKAKRELGEAGTLYFGVGGERWLDAKKDGVPAASATTFLPEDIVGGLPLDAKGTALALVGESGTIYSASSPLGPVDAAKHAPPAKVFAVATGKANAVVIADSVVQHTTNFGVSWTKSTLPKLTGAPIAVALGTNGVGALLFAPGKVLVTYDDGVTFHVAPFSGAATRVTTDNAGHVFVQSSASEYFEITGDAAGPKLEKAKKAPEFTLELPFPGRDKMEYAQAVNSGAGVIVGGKYYEAVADAFSDDWEIVTEDLAAPASTKRLHGLGSCFNPHISVAGDHIVATCNRTLASSSSKEGEDRMLVIKSTDGGKTWGDDATLTSGGRTDERVWLASSGALIIKNACTIPKADDCDGHGIVRPAGATAFENVKVDLERPSFYALKFSPKGDIAYAVGTAQTKSEGKDEGDDGEIRMPFVFVSRDGGRSFTHKKLPPVAETETLSYSSYARRMASIALDDSGKVIAVAVAYEGRWHLYHSSDDGETWAERALPFVEAVSLAGKRGYARGAEATSYETSDAGATWHLVNAPADSEPSVACSEVGCLSSKKAVRLGWDGTGELWSADAKFEPAGEIIRAAKTIKCTPEADWVSFGVSELTTKGIDVAKDARFLNLVRDSKTGAAKVLLPTVGKKGFEARAIPLFAPSKAPTSLRTYQVAGGAVALRNTLPPLPKSDKDSGKDGKDGVKPSPKGAKRDKGGSAVAADAGAKQPPIDVDIAWYVAATGKVHKATLRGVSPRVDYEAFAIQKGGFYLSAGLGADSAIYWVSESGKVEKLPYPGKIGTHPYTRDMFRDGTTGVFVTNSTDGSATTTAYRYDDKAKTWSHRVLGTWAKLVPGTPSVERLSLGGRPAISLVYGHGGLRPTSFAAFLKSGDTEFSDVLAVTNQSLLGDPPRACGKEAATWSRLVSRFTLGTRHPVLANVDGKDVAVGTTDAILRVSDTGEGCLSTFATGKRYLEATYEFVIAADDMAHSYVVKQSKGERFVRPASCAYTADPVPAALKEEEGFHEPAPR